MVLLLPNNYVKCLDIFINKNLSQDYNITQLSSKLLRLNGIFSKLHHFTSTVLLNFSLLFFVLF